MKNENSASGRKQPNHSMCACRSPLPCRESCAALRGTSTATKRQAVGHSNHAGCRTGTRNSASLLSCFGPTIFCHDVCKAPVHVHPMLGLLEGRLCSWFLLLQLCSPPSSSLFCPEMHSKIRRGDIIREVPVP